MKKLEGKITISRPQYGDGRELITLRFTDDLSRGRFLEVQVSPGDFAMAVTGASEMPCLLLVESLETVGLKKITENRSCVCPLRGYDKAELELWLIQNAKEEGWAINPYLGSKSSCTTSPDGETVLHYSVYKYVEQGLTNDQG